MSERAPRVPLPPAAAAAATAATRTTTGLCHQEWVLCGLWRLIRSVGPPRAFLDLLALTSKANGPEFLLLQLFCDCATHLLTILDDLELYEQQRPFTLQDLVALSAFLNLFVFRLLWAGLIGGLGHTSLGLAVSPHMGIL